MDFIANNVLCYLFVTLGWLQEIKFLKGTELIKINFFISILIYKCRERHLDQNVIDMHAKHFEIEFINSSSVNFVSKQIFA